jgi:peptidoglycan/LPS O-acetylase OafA/YrhL
MPEPLTTGRRYMPGLDGLRALAVAAVIAYHLGLGWASGGLLGVGVFFTLSGYLITDLLLGQQGAGRLRLRQFWLARARRLLPALFAMLIVVGIWVWVDDRAQLSLVRGQTLAALVYLSNWWQSVQHLSYFARFGPPSPLNHLWSLSVEEQFYLLWPWLLLLGVRVVHERPRSIPMRPRLAALTVVLAAASAIEMALLFHPSFDPSRIYYGTDTRAFGLLFGAALAFVWPSRALRPRVGAHAGAVLDAAGVIGLVGIGVLIWRTNQYSAFVYRGGLVLLSLCTVMVIAALTHPAARLGRVLGTAPLRWLGVRSYGIYLWHAPVIALTTPTANRGVQPLRAVLQVTASVALAALSWRYLEDPIRHGALRRLCARARAVSWNPRRLAGSVQVALAGAGAALALACLGLSGAVASPSITPVLNPAEVQASVVGPVTTPAARSSDARKSDRPQRSTPSRSASPGTGGQPRTTAATTTPAGGASSAGPQRGQPLTSCRSVVHIGDSTSEGMISTDYLPAASQRLPAQYARVGVRRSIMEITGGTSIVETLPGGVNAHSVAQGLVADGYRGCWVIALGTNDTADIYVGSSLSLATRIREMMSAIGNEPVLWVNAKTLVSSGPYSEANMQTWNQALVSACARYPNMRIYDWASAAKDRWFIPDGIHYYSPGYAARAHLIADALAEAFPDGAAASASCTVTTPSITLPVLGVH